MLLEGNCAREADPAVGEALLLDERDDRGGGVGPGPADVADDGEDAGHGDVIEELSQDGRLAISRHEHVGFAPAGPIGEPENV